MPNNLPAPVSSFIGRAREIGEVRRLLAENRLLTLAGPGGCGKTRLAIQVAVQVAGELGSDPDQAVWLIEFAPLADAALVPQAVASAMGMREQGGRSLPATLADYLLDRKTLLVFDNCEHLVDACAQLAEALLRACPELRLLATSREPLGVAGETVWTVPPLSLPEPQPGQRSAAAAGL